MRLNKEDSSHFNLIVPGCWHDMLRELSRRENSTQKEITMTCVANFAWNKYRLRMTDFLGEDPLKKSIEREVRQEYKNQINHMKIKNTELTKKVTLLEALLQQAEQDQRKELIMANTRGI